jgi:hypothetical protein
METLDETLEALIDSMPPGQEMDVLVARALGQTNFNHPKFLLYQEKDKDEIVSAGYFCVDCRSVAGYTGPCVRSYSFDLQQAYRIIEWWITEYSDDQFIERWQDGEWFLSDKN